MPSGFSDECDPCAARPNDNFCGSDVGWTGDGANVAVKCVGGKLSTKNTCAGKTCNKNNCPGDSDPSLCCP